MAAAVEAVVAGAERDRKPELPAIAEDLAHEVTLLGTYERAIETMAVWFAAGADSVTLVLPPGRPERELAEIVEVAAGAVATYARAA
jgi:alkanesulfonate monooxygenase SsuD/methylene tetrahydromethanopterin reductase-like flavin-dependent oxidoreductase (luciferase family)